MGNVRYLEHQQEKARKQTRRDQRELKSHLQKFGVINDDTMKDYTEFNTALSKLAN